MVRPEKIKHNEFSLNIRDFFSLHALKQDIIPKNET